MPTDRVVAPTDVLWRRIGAWLLDLVLPALAGVVLTVLVHPVLGLLALLAVWAAEAVVLQGRIGATPGKALTRLRVVDAEGDLCDTRAAFLRTVLWVADGFPWVAPLAGYAAAFGDPLGRRLGDRVAGTYVVDARFVGHPPFTVVFPADGGPARRLERGADYQQGWTNPVVRTGGYAGATEPVAATPGGPQGAAPAAAPSTAPVPTDTADANAAAAPAPPLALPAGSGAAYDRELGGYLRWDEVHQTWAVFDEASRQWRAVTGRPAPVRR